MAKYHFIVTHKLQLVSILLLQHLIFFAYGQSNFDRDFSKFKAMIIDSVVHVEIKDSLEKSSKFRGKEAIIAPYCFYRILQDKKTNDRAALNFVEFPKSFHDFAYKIVNWQNKLYCFPTIRIKNFPFINDITSPDSSFVSNYYQIEMIDYVRKLSNVFFFLKVLPREPAGNTPLGFIYKGRLMLVDRDLNSFDNLNKFVVKQYGSKDKFLELYKEDVERDRLVKKMSYDDCKQIFRDDYVLWERHFPTDSAKILVLLINELKKAARLTPQQEFLLRQRIKERSSWSSDSKCSTSLYLFGTDITGILLSVLTEDQMVRFMHNRRLVAWLESFALNKLVYYYLIIKKVPSENEDKVLNEEIFSHN